VRGFGGLVGLQRVLKGSGEGSGEFWGILRARMLDKGSWASSGVVESSWGVVIGGERLWGLVRGF